MWIVIQMLNKFQRHFTHTHYINFRDRKINKNIILQQQRDIFISQCNKLQQAKVSHDHTY